MFTPQALAGWLLIAVVLIGAIVMLVVFGNSSTY